MSAWPPPIKAAGTEVPVVAPTPTTYSPEAVLAERRAWVVIWLAFATFCILAYSAVKFTVEYVTTAEIDLAARIEGTRGLVFLQQAGARRAILEGPDRELEVGSVVETGRPGYLNLRFFEGSRMEALPGARVELERMDVGRFINRRSLVVGQVAGVARYQPAEEMAVSAPYATVRVAPRSDVTVWVEAGRTRVLVYEGEARLEVDGSTLVVPAGFRGQATAERRLEGPDPRIENLVRNGDFARRGDEWVAHDLQSGPQDVDGRRLFGEGPVVDGKVLPAMRIVRDSVTLAHGETGVRQALGVAVSGYRSLWLEAWVKVDRASLSGGGQLGSEYPMMLSLDYEGIREGDRPGWVHSFYYANPENRPVHNAERVEQGEWKLYRVNILDQDEAHRPYRLLGMAIMGQGHTYDAWVAGVRLIGD